MPLHIWCDCFIEFSEELGHYLLICLGFPCPFFCITLPSPPRYKQQPSPVFVSSRDSCWGRTSEQPAIAASIPAKRELIRPVWLLAKKANWNNLETILGFLGRQCQRLLLRNKETNDHAYVTLFNNRDLSSWAKLLRYKLLCCSVICDLVW